MLLYHLTTGPVKELKLRHGLNSEEFIVLPVPVQIKERVTHILQNVYRLCFKLQTKPLALHAVSGGRGGSFAPSRCSTPFKETHSNC